MVALDCGVVETVALRAHRLRDAGGAQALAEDERDVLPGFKGPSQRYWFTGRIVIRDPNPVLFFEQKSLYTRIKGRFTYDPSVPFAGAAVRRTGADMTVVSYGAAVHQAFEAVETLAAEGIDCELIDLRVLSPLDFETIAASVTRTSRCVIAHEDYPDYGIGAEIAARLVSELFEHLDAPVARVGAGFWPIPFSPPLEEATLPNGGSNR